MTDEEIREFWNKFVEELDLEEILLEWLEKEYWNSFFPYRVALIKKMMGR